MTVVIGTAGHIDHGKTTLLRALTGIDPDRLPEERRRGMTIDVGYAHLTLPDGTVLDFVDVPGHDKLVGNMLVGAGEIDAAMFVVAADDGPRAQTVEHLELLDALDIRHGVVVVTKTDIVGADRVADVVAAVERLIAPTSLAGAPIIGVSGITGDGLPALLAALAGLSARVLPRAGTAPRLAIDRVFTVRGRGVVVTGTLRGGPLERGATLRLEPGGHAVRVREIQVHGRTVERADDGRTALNIAGVEAAQVERGLTLVGDGGGRAAVDVTDRLLVVLRPSVSLGSGEPRLPSDRARVRLHLDTAQVAAVVGRSGREAVVLDDGSVAALLRLERPLPVAPGDRFVLRRPSPARTEAGGRVLDTHPPAGVSRKRVTAERIRSIVTARTNDERWAALLDLHGALSRPRDASGGVALAVDVAATLAGRVAALVAAGALPLAQLRSVLATELRRLVTLSADDAASAAGGVIEAALEGGRIVRDGDRVRDPRHEARGVSPSVAAAMDRLEAALAMPAPPPLSAAARAAGCPADGIRALEAAGRIVRVGTDLAWAAAAYRDLESAALELASRAPLTPAALRDATGTSRKYVMALLEDLGRRAVLRRTPEGHVPGPRAAASVR